MEDNILDLKFQWYKNGITNIKPNGFISLRQLINTIISPKPEMIEAFNLIKEAGARGDKETKDRLKTERLFFTTPSVIFDPIRNYESIKQFHPIGIYEYDDIPHASELRDYIFERRKDCIFAFNSPSATGCKFVFNFGETPKTIEHYKELWLGIAHDLDKFINLDYSNLRCTQPLFNSYDPEAKFREDSIGFGARGYKEDSFKPYEGGFETTGEGTEEEKEECKKVVCLMLANIERDGHGTVVRASTLAGGFCSQYGIEAEEMLNYLEDCVRSSDYLSKGTEGYLKTARTMFNKGLDFPAELKKKKNEK